jgi:hypothetical protein
VTAGAVDLNPPVERADEVRAEDEELKEEEDGVMDLEEE